MSQKKIMVLLGRSPKALRSVHYALALAERIQADVLVLQHARRERDDVPMGHVFDEALLEVINSARQAGLRVSHRVTSAALADEVVSVSRREDIELVVYGAEDRECVSALPAIRPQVTSQIVQVQEKKVSSSCD